MDVEERVERLEREVRLYRRVVVVLALIFAAGMAMAQTGYQDHIICRSLRVVGEGGQDVVTIEPGEQGGRVQIRNGDGIVTTVIGQTDYGSGMLAVKSQTGEDRVEVTTVDAGGAIEVLNKHDEIVIDMFPNEAGNGRLGVWNRQGTGRLCESQ